jgi:uncharacterized protein (TIGR02145 family)
MGIAYGKKSNPTVVADKNVPYASFGVGTFRTYLEDALESGTTYYVRAYATNAAGTAYGNEITFNTLPQSLFNPNLTYGTMSDNDGNTYKTIQIGTQTWMAEDLRTTKYRNGDPIPTLDNEFDWYQTSSDARTGGLYNWFAVADSRNLCPAGWHVPSDGEWTTLENFLGGVSVAGGKMKTTTGWNDYNGQNGNGTNESGFSGLPGGYRGDNGTYFAIGNYGGWWSSTEYSAMFAWYRYLFYGDGYSGRGNNYEPLGLSVRCLRD